MQLPPHFRWSLCACYAVSHQHTCMARLGTLQDGAEPGLCLDCLLSLPPAHAAHTTGT
jgi:hypothetical protein